ncbi:MAG: hypothetical protein WCR52_11380 [Bacteroidota bacterium]
MEKSKLIELVRSFSTREWSAFQDFVRSPYFNRNPVLIRFCEFLAAQAPDFKALHPEKAFAALFPGEPYQDAALKHAMSFLLKLGEQFIGQMQYERNEVLPEYFTLKGLVERELEKHYHYLYDRTVQKQLNRERRDAIFHYEQYMLANLEANRLSHSTARVFNDHVQRTADQLDYFYLAEKLRCTCYMLTSQVVLATPYNLQLVDEITRFIKQYPMPDEAPSIHAYFHIFQLLRQENAHSDFEALKKLLVSHESRFSREELAEIYEYAINFCNLQILKLKEPFVEEALNLYIKGVESGILLQKEKLSPWHFKNMIKLALRLERFEWTEHFILQSKHLLETGFQEDAYYYNLAELYYYTGRLDDAMLHLNKVEFTDIHYNLGSKVLLVKIYYETEASNALESLLDSFKNYLQRNKIISEELRRSYINFISLVRRILRASPAQYPALREKAQQLPLLSSKNWLLRILE